MPKESPISVEALVRNVQEAGPRGISAEELERIHTNVSRSTLNRRLSKLITDGIVKTCGKASATRYVALSSLTIDAINAYFEKSHIERPIARYDERLLDPAPGIDPDKAERLEQLNALAPQLDRRFLSHFLIDISWSSQILEGGTYTNLDTQALLNYGQRNKEKPVEDAILILCHKGAVEYLWENRALTKENICALQSRLTDDHGVKEVADSDHFLPSHQRGVPREYEEVNLQQSAYLPPHRPGSGYISEALDLIILTAHNLSPVEASFYLMTRIPYLQAFANGNKRTSRLAANIPLLEEGLLPISFVDFNRAEYIRGMDAFYELGSTTIMEKVFSESYIKSIIRSSDIPVSMRVNGLDIQETSAALLAYVATGKFPSNPVAAALISTGRQMNFTQKPPNFPIR